MGACSVFQSDTACEKGEGSDTRQRHIWDGPPLNFCLAVYLLSLRRRSKRRSQRKSSHSLKLMFTYQPPRRDRSVLGRRWSNAHPREGPVSTSVFLLGLFRPAHDGLGRWGEPNQLPRLRLCPLRPCLATDRLDHAKTCTGALGEGAADGRGEGVRRAEPVEEVVVRHVEPPTQGLLAPLTHASWRVKRGGRHDCNCYEENKSELVPRPCSLVTARYRDATRSMQANARVRR